MKKVLLLLIMLIPALGFAQEKMATVKSTDSLTFAKVELESAYPGGLDGWRKYLMSNMHYPTRAMRNNIQRKVIVQFIVEADGRVSSIEAIEGPEMLAAESVRLIKESGKWLPAQQDGKSVKSYKKQPFIFKLQNG